MINIQNKVDCCGCNACGDICPKGAIIFAQDDEGFLYPKVDAYKCINCGLCENTCPQIHHADIKHNEFDKPKITAAIHKNYAIRFDSTSGGVFSALAKVIYSQGGFVGGAVWTEDWEIRQVVTDKRSDLPKLRSSKYAQSDARGFYSVVKSALGSGKPVMVCGTPCQMAALRLFVGKEYPNLYILDFICRGNNTPLLMKKYIEHHEQEAGGKLVSIKFKNKELGWRNLTKKMVFDNGKIMWDTKDRSLFSACYHKCHVFCRPSCYECKCKGIPFVSDITLGDCWVKKGVLKPEMDYDLGTSVVLINNSKGEMLFNQAAKSMLLQEIPWEAFLDGNRMFDKSIPVPEYDRDKLYCILRDKGIKAVVDFVGKSSAQSSIKYRIKNWLRRMYIIKCKVGFSIPTLARLLRFNGLNRIVTGKPLVFATPRSQILNNGGEIRLAKDIQLGNGQFVNPPYDTYVVVRKGGVLEFKGSCHFTYGAAVEVHEGGRLVIEDDCGFNVGATIVCANKVVLGRGVKGGRNVTIRDNNGGHWMNFPGYKDSRPVEIGDHVWLCEGCTIMPGVKIGAGAVIGAKAVVFEDVPANSIVVGNPAKVVNDNVEWKY